MNRAVKILVCDDEELVRWALVEGLTSQGYDVVEAADGEQALERFRESRPALVLLDVRMPGMDGLTALRHLREQGADTPVIILSALGDIGVAVEATRLGADRYMTKPFDLNDVYDAVEDALSRERLAAKVDTAPATRRYAGLIGQAASMQRIYATLDRLSGLETPTVLITGESGTGKDLVARSIHQVGRRSTGPFVEVDCTAIPETLMESTLFGHERGAFTDARAQHRGLFEVAQGGVVFLDEIGELPLPLQAKLLRVLENRTFKRVGGTQGIPFDAAVITATNRDLLGEVRNGRFREDLYYRLAVVQLELPPLRARAEDIAPLVEHFVQGYNRTFGRKVARISGGAIEKLMQWRWPGNVRELRNIVECAVIFNETETIDVDDLPPHIRYARKIAAAPAEENPFVLPAEGVSLDQVERSLVRQALDRTDGNVTAAAKLLGLSRYALRNRAIKFGFLQGGENDE
jgi:DNA-binding NtrC family response regulator